MRNHFLTLIIFIFLLFFTQTLEKEDKSEYFFVNNYIESFEEKNKTNITLDQIVTGYIEKNSSTTYQLLLLNDTETLFFDFQSEFGCLYINLDKVRQIPDFEFCSNGESNVFALNKSEINEKRGEEEKKSIEGLNIYISVSNNESEIIFNLEFYYSLKVSRRKEVINIFEINSPHKMVCHTEKVDEDGIYKCLFVFVNKKNTQDNEENDKNLIIYSTSHKKGVTVDMYVNYIDKEIYDNWDTEILKNSTPTKNNSEFNSTKTKIINIPNYSEDKYVYISVESDETLIEIIAQSVSIKKEIQLPEMNEIQIFYVNESSTLDFNDVLKGDISMSIITIFGKAKIKLGFNESIDYIVDSLESQLILDFDLSECNGKCYLTFNNLKDNNVSDYIFYITYTRNNMNSLKELSYGKSSKLIYNDYNNKDLYFYQPLPCIFFSVNINFRIYSDVINRLLDSDIFKVEVIAIKKKDLYNIKLNNSLFDNYVYKKEGKFDKILSSTNIYISSPDFTNFNVLNDPYVIIRLSKTNKRTNIGDLILSSTIYQMDGLTHPSERLYHYGKLNDRKTIVYKLQGKSNYKLMRLEFGADTYKIGWSVKRTNNTDKYQQNDTDLSFVTEKWINGRELLTMYIERGEDIYLTIFKKDDQYFKNESITNYVFKYINSGKNYDFKNYYVKNDQLTYEPEGKKIYIQELKKIPSYSSVNYFLKIINEDKFINEESLNTIALIETRDNITIKGKKSGDNIVFKLSDYFQLNSSKEVYYLSAYGVVNENCSDYEYIAYSSVKIKGQSKVSFKMLVIASLAITGVSVIVLITSLIRYCTSSSYY